MFKTATGHPGAPSVPAARVVKEATRHALGPGADFMSLRTNFLILHFWTK
jgi:hypothetical protein